jgi:ketosteroid isomerase-like protein
MIIALNLPAARLHRGRIGENPSVPETDSIAAARHTIEAWNKGDEESIRGAFSDDVHYVPSGEIPGYTKPIDGIEEYVGFFRDWMSSFTDYTLMPRRVTDIGAGGVLVDTDQEGTSASGAKVSRRIFMHAVMRNGRCVSYAAFTDERSVLEHAGLDSWPAEPD